MITNIKRKDLKKLDKEGIDGNLMYYALDLAADKIRAIYTLFGWNQANNDMFETSDTVMELASHCFNDLLDHPKNKESSHSTGGITVSVWDEDGFDTLQLDVKFNILN